MKSDPFFTDSTIVNTQEKRYKFFGDISNEQHSTLITPPLPELLENVSIDTDMPSYSLTKLPESFQAVRNELTDEVKLTQQLLTEINSQLKSQLSSLTEALTVLLHAVSSDNEFNKTAALETNKLLAELKTLIVYKDNEGINQFLTEHPQDNVRLILKYLSSLISYKNEATSSYK